MAMRPVSTTWATARRSASRSASQRPQSSLHRERSQKQTTSGPKMPRMSSRLSATTSASVSTFAKYWAARTKPRAQ
jgi:hypothetical protein